MKNLATNAAVKVLIVDDSTFIATRLKQMVDDVRGYSCVGVAHSLIQGLEMVQEVEPNVVILDIHLTDGNMEGSGIDLLKVLRRDFEHITVIMMTNFSESGYREKCLELGAHYFFDKTNDFDKIPGTLTSII